MDIGKNGRPTTEFLKRLYDFIRENHGRNNPVPAAYYDDADYRNIADLAVKRKKDKKRYNLLRNNCKTFAREVIEAGRE